MEKFTIGLVLGAVGGALLTANSYKMRTLVKKSQDEIKQRLDEMMDEKLKDIQNGGCVFASSEGGEKSPEKSESEGQGRDESEKKERGK